MTRTVYRICTSLVAGVDFPAQHFPRAPRAFAFPRYPHILPDPMKAQRRHQLQANELARQLETFPETLKRNASTILLVITACVVVFFVVRYRRAAAENRQVNLANALLNARDGPNRLRGLDMEQGQAPPELIASERNAVISGTRTAIDTILREAEGDEGMALRAEALVAK